MERRKEPRISAANSVRLTVLDKDRYSVQAATIDFSGRGMRLRVPFELPAGTLVRIDSDDVLLLGEICYCNRLDNHCVAGIKLDQVLKGLPDLEALNRELLGEERRETEKVAHGTVA